MPTYQAPGVYVEEIPLTPAIPGVGTSTAGFIGVSTGAKMPDQPDGTPYPLAPVEEPQLVTNFDQFKRFFGDFDARSEEHTSELQSRPHLVCRLLLEKKKQ